jgi:cell division septation protein DedD
MDWFRRNWPDLLIGIALVAVIAGIIATLITGGSFFPVGQNTRTSAPPAQSATTQSAAPKSATPSPSSKTTTGNQASPGSKTAANAGGANGTTTAAPAGGANGVSVLPPTASAPGNGTPAQSATTTPAKTANPPAVAAPAPAGNGATQSTATSQNGPGSAAPYRISVGAFSHETYAQRQEKVFKDAGYPVFLASQGDLTIVLVGPYKSQSEADQVAAKIKKGSFGVDPVVYHFQGAQDQAPSAAQAGTTSTTSSTAAPATSTSTSTSAPATASSGQRYLQVGAYDSAAGAKPQRDRMTSMGFSVQERTENGLVKVLIGPFGPARLQQVQAQLKAAGIDSFPR